MLRFSCLIRAVKTQWFGPSCASLTRVPKVGPIRILRVITPGLPSRLWISLLHDLL